MTVETSGAFETSGTFRLADASALISFCVFPFQFGLGVKDAGLLRKCHFLTSPFACAIRIMTGYGTGVVLLPGLPLNQLFDLHRQLADAHPGCMMDCVADGGRRSSQTDFSHATSAKRVEI